MTRSELESALTLCAICGRVVCADRTAEHAALRSAADADDRARDPYPPDRLEQYRSTYCQPPPPRSQRQRRP
jgi:hypothetical protein